MSAQHALAREVSEPAVIVAASDDNLQRPDDLPPEASDSALMDGAEARGMAAAKQPSLLTKHFSFLSSLRRGQTLTDTSNPVAATEMAELPEVAEPGSTAEQSQDGAAASATRNAAAGQSLDDAAAATPRNAAAAPAVAAAVASRGQMDGVVAKPIVLPPVFDYGSEVDEAGSPRRQAASTVVDTEVVLHTDFPCCVISHDSSALQPRRRSTLW